MNICMYFMKLFWTGSVLLNLAIFLFSLPSVLLKNHAERFDIKCKYHANLLCQIVKHI